MILELKNEVPLLFWGRPGGMRRVPGGNIGGYKDAIIAGVTRTRHLVLSGYVQHAVPGGAADRFAHSAGPLYMKRSVC